MAVDVSSPIECWDVRGFLNFHKKNYLMECTCVDDVICIYDALDL